MISTVKEYGSYKLVDVANLLHIDDGSDHNEDYVTECAVKNKWIELELIHIIKYNHDTSIFTFATPHQQKLNLPIGGYLLLSTGSVANNAVRPYTSISDESAGNSDYKFDLLVKRYDEWGTQENPKTHFLFTKTNHSYKPPGIVSNYIHTLKLGDYVKFKHNRSCSGKVVSVVDDLSIQSITMVCVGVGIAPMIQILRKVLKTVHIRRLKIVLLYGVRTVEDILMKHVLDQFQESHDTCFKVIYCVGSRYSNVHMGASSKKLNEYVAPSIPSGFSLLKHAELGWVTEDKIRKHGYPPSEDTRVFVCGLPGVYEKICGSRFIDTLTADSALHKLGYSAHMVIKL